MEKLVEVLSEQEVRIDFALNCKCRANVLLRSLCASAPVAFKVQTSSPHKFLVNPPSGVISPLSNTTLQIILKPQSQLPPSFPRSHSDRFLIKTAQFEADLDQPDSLNSWFSSRSTQDIKLKVAFVGPFLLQHAVGCGDFEAVRNILKRQKSVLYDLSPEEAESLLRIATELADADDMVNLLLEAGLRVDAGVETNNVGFFTVNSRSTVAPDRTEEEARFSKMAGSESFDWTVKEGRTPLHSSVGEGNIQCAKDAKSKDEKNALYRAAANGGDRRMVEMLPEKGTDPTIADDRGRSPRDVVPAKGYKEVAGILEGGKELLTAARRGEVERLRLLLHRGVNINYCDQYGLTALHAAAIRGNKDVVLMLVESGLDLNCRDNEDHAPLHLAVEGGHLELVETLVDMGANVNIKSKRGATPLHMADTMGFTGISQFLVKKGASPSMDSSESLNSM
ncbi:hypothetical protein SLE2022_072160 [Rubroshorea leprosula]